jgi:hypothetical protein
MFVHVSIHVTRCQSKCSKLLCAGTNACMWFPYERAQWRHLLLPTLLAKMAPFHGISRLLLTVYRLYMSIVYGPN